MYIFLISLTQSEHIIDHDHGKSKELENIQCYCMPRDINDDQKEIDKFPPTEQQQLKDKQVSSTVYKLGSKNQDKEKLYDNKKKIIPTVNVLSTQDSVCYFIFTSIKIHTFCSIFIIFFQEKIKSTKKPLNAEEIQKNISVYQFKEDLIQAIKDNRVCNNLILIIILLI